MTDDPVQETHQNPLGRAADYPQEYTPQVLFGIARANARAPLLTDSVLPFSGEDIWNAWELSWLDLRGKPVVAIAELRVPADSSHIIESKSLKLYLNSLANTRFADSSDLQKLICKDLTAVAGAPVNVTVVSATDAMNDEIVRLPGTCIDDLPLSPDNGGPDAALLEADLQHVLSETLHSHLLRSNCPVTNQPDTGSIMVRYSGPRISAGSLLEYIVSYRNHNDFHEACVERIFVDIKQRCKPENLTVYARYNRRGGLDINPFRTDFEKAPDNGRLWRQ